MTENRRLFSPFPNTGSEMGKGRVRIFSAVLRILTRGSSPVQDGCPMSQSRRFIPSVELLEERNAAGAIPLQSHAILVGSLFAGPNEEPFEDAQAPSTGGG